jgi:hypothetical protein
MARMLATTNSEGALFDVVRADPVDAGGGSTLQSVPANRPGVRHKILELPDDFIGNPGEEVLREVRRRLAL